MKCFNHPNQDATGLCKQCYKGICTNCSSHEHSGLTCSKPCEDEMKDIDEIIKRSKQAYKIGQDNHGKAPYPTSNIIYFLAGTLFLGLGIYDANKTILILGAGFIVIGIINWYKIRKFYSE